MILTSYVPLIENTLKSILSSKSSTYKVLFEAAKYSLLNPGKRLRPLLTIATAEAFGAPFQKALIPGCAIEILHTYSLIHDDLPSMDNDDFRRGKPSLHKVYPEGQAILAGDLLLTLAFETLSQSPDLTSDQIVELVSILSQRSGGEGMIGGQSLDLLYEGKTISWDLLQTIHLSKTAALISACLEFGAVIAKTSKADRKLLFSIGQEIGLSFQIVDDVLDIEGAPELIGKPLLSDLARGKATSVSLLGLQAAKNLSETLLCSALEKCKTLGIQDSALADILPRLVQRTF